MNPSEQPQMDKTPPKKSPEQARKISAFFLFASELIVFGIFLWSVLS